MLGRALAQPPEDADGDSGQPLAPGMLASHYAPRTQVRLDADSDLSRARRCWRSARMPCRAWTRAAAVMNLSARGDLNEAAANLFGYLRALDAKGARAIAVMPIPA